MLRFVPLLVAIGVAALLFIAPIARSQSIAINEIMYAPAAPEPEWIELYNFDSVHMQVITKWSIESGTKAVLTNVQIDPLGYLILTKDSATLRAKRPGSYPIVQIALPNLRNSGDTVYLRDSSGRAVDSVGYQASWGGSGGRSLERIDAEGASNDRVNWSKSKDSSGATTGRANSVRLPDHDFGIVKVEQIDSSVVVTLRNEGKLPGHCSVALQLTAIDTLRKASDNIASRDSESVVFTLPNKVLGRSRGIAYCNDSLDQNRSNDTLPFIFSKPIPRDSVVINEIMFEPSVNSCEWVELYNTSQNTVSLLNSSLRVGEGHPRNFEIDTQIIVPPNSYAVIAADSLIYNSYPALSGHSGIIIQDKASLDLVNDSATVVFESYDSLVVDSVHYFNSWHTTRNLIHAGLSLERIDPQKSANDPKNWQTSTDPLGATPLAKNSGRALNDTLTNVSTSMEFSPNPFSPDGDGFEDESELSVTSGDELDYVMRIRLFDARGMQVRTLADGLPFRISSTTAFDGKNDRGQVLAPGLYAALVELSSSNPPKVISKTIGVVIAGKKR